MTVSSDSQLRLCTESPGGALQTTDAKPHVQIELVRDESQASGFKSSLDDFND